MAVPHRPLTDHVLAGHVLTDELIRGIERTRATYRFVRLRAMQTADITPEEGPYRIATFGDALVTDWQPMPRVFCFDHTQIEHLDAILDWYAEVDRPPHFELLPYADNRVVFDALSERGFAPRYTISVLLHHGAAPPAPDGVVVRRSDDDEIDKWVGAYIDGHEWTPTADERPAWVRELHVQYVAPGITRYAAEADGRVVGIAAAYRADGVNAHLTNAATLTTHRGRGLHGAFIAARLRDLYAEGATVVAADTTPQSGSQRNLERAGFRIAYQKTHWEQIKTRSER